MALRYDDYLTDPYTPEGTGSDGSQGAPPPAAAAPSADNPTTNNTNTDTYDPMKDRSKTPPKRDGFIWEWDERNGRWMEYVDPAAGRKTPGGETAPPVPVGTIGQPNWGESGPFDPYQSPGAFKPRQDTFQFDPYTPSSWEDAENEPGFRQSQDRLRKEIEAGAAYRGMLRSGMTLTDLDTGLGSSRRQNFESFDSRRFRNYSANRDNAFGAFTANYGIDRDIYDRGAQDVDRGNNYRFNVSSQKFQDALARWQEQVRSITSIATAGAGS